LVDDRQEPPLNWNISEVRFERIEGTNNAVKIAPFQLILKHQYLDETILLDLSTPDLRAEFFGITVSR
jgi:hypothetical protein